MAYVIMAENQLAVCFGSLVLVQPSGPLLHICLSRVLHYAHLALWITRRFCYGFRSVGFGFAARCGRFVVRGSFGPCGSPFAFWVYVCLVKLPHYAGSAFTHRSHRAATSVRCGACHQRYRAFSGGSCRRFRCVQHRWRLMVRSGALLDRGTYKNADRFGCRGRCAMRAGRMVGLGSRSAGSFVRVRFRSLQSSGLFRVLFSLQRKVSVGIS